MIIKHVRSCLLIYKISKKYGYATVENFGSSANSLWSNDSDIDIVIEFQKEQVKKQGRKGKKAKENSKENEFKKVDYVKALCDVRNVIRPLALNGQLEGVFGARIPILKFKDAKSGIDCDISINNTAGIPNSKLTRLYCEYDQRAHIMVKYLRHALKNAGLLYGDQGCLSSYSILLMVIAFLQNQDEPILPNLQDVPDKCETVTVYSINKNRYGRVACKEINTKVNENLKAINKKFKSKNEKSVAQLVVEFLDFYFLHETIDKPQIDVSKGGFVDTETDQYSLLDIVEPFNTSARVGQGCRKDSHHGEAYTQFAFDFCKGLIDLK